MQEKSETLLRNRPRIQATSPTDETLPHPDLPNSVQAVVVVRAGAVYYSDPNNHRNRKVSLERTVTTVVGSGPAGA
jgi:hypothetical protein